MEDHPIQKREKPESSSIVKIDDYYWYGWVFGRGIDFLFFYELESK